MARFDVIVVGAGLAGLSAAHRLTRAGRRVRVYDPEPPGGKARTVEPSPGWTVEWGPHTFTHRAEPLFQLVDDLGLADRLVTAGPHARARFLVRDGKLRRAGPFTGAVRLGELFGIVRGLFRASEPRPAETLRDWVARVFGASLADGPAGAGTVGIWAARPEEIEVAAAFPALAAGLRAHGSLFRMMRAPKTGPGRPSGTFTLRGGLGTLTTALAEQVEAVPRAVLGVERGRGARWRVSVEGEQVEADAVVIATEGPTAKALLAGPAPRAAEALAGIRYSPLLVAHWLTRDDGVSLPHGFGWLAPPSERRPVLGTLFVSDLRPDAAPAGMRSFATMIGGTLEPAALGLDAQAARSRVEAEVVALTGQAPRFEGLHLVRHPLAVPLPEPGHGARVAAVHAALPEGMLLAGAWCGMGAMHEAIAAGWRAADALLGPSAGGS